MRLNKLLASQSSQRKKFLKPKPQTPHSDLSAVKEAGVGGCGVCRHGEQGEARLPILAGGPCSSWWAPGEGTLRAEGCRWGWRQISIITILAAPLTPPLFPLMVMIRLIRGSAANGYRFSPLQHCKPRFVAIVGTTSLQASEDPRTGVELSDGTFSARQARSPGFRSHTEHLIQKHPASVFWQQSGGWKGQRPHPGLLSTEADQQFFSSWGMAGTGSTGWTTTHSPGQSARSSLHPSLTTRLAHPHTSPWCRGLSRIELGTAEPGRSSGRGEVGVATTPCRGLWGQGRG